MTELDIPSPASLEVKVVWQSLAEAHRYLAELKGLCESLPNRAILLDTLAIQEAKDSSEIENIITTHDELYAYDQSGSASPAAKEVQNYIAALKVGFTDVVNSGLIRISTILRVQEQVEQNNAGFRKVPGTVLKNQTTGAVIYEPPQDAVLIEKLMAQLVDFIHADNDYDPVLRMGIAHHQFENIHPFYDGNGRTGRVLNSLFLIQEDLLTLPILYLSRYIIKNKTEYYRLLLDVTRNQAWEPWIIFLLQGIEDTAHWTTAKIAAIRTLSELTITHVKQAAPKIYSRELVDLIFDLPYCRIQNLVEKNIAGRQAASRYLKQLLEIGVLQERTAGREKLFIHPKLMHLLTRDDNTVVPYP